ncbi:site-specific DNA-methyltransferase [Shewanella bicestrii]|uniref:site-specific DNA-methyltransferase (adenine-specific) n=1 Tax=Shewanella bicestrii TaxID=2018305 RepID=A0A220UJX0_9GAMM|nr:site-specific DNA-methyltransferase [Shewanella bicestrii]ASK68477.1 site-specific DNA-methyltransferase [Shewanella bicestrii]
MANEEQTNVEKYEFEPIKGYPMLSWKGKRPFRSTQYFPAQLKEVYGREDDNGWINKIFWGDNLQVMSHLLKEFRGKIDLVYIDPPFDSKADYKISIKTKGKSVSNDQSGFEEKQYTDIWTNDEYLQFMYERLTLIRELLSETGSIYLHCDWHKSHYLRLICDEVFGVQNFRNEIIWQRGNPRVNASGHFSHNTDTILFYSKSEGYYFEPQYTPLAEDYINRYYTKTCELTGEKFMPSPLIGHVGTNKEYEWKGFVRAWRYPKHRLDELDSIGRIYWPSSGEGVPRFKKYLDESKGRAVQSLWTDISSVNSQAKEDTQYPTQKPLDLLKRIIEASCPENGIVFDCFMGSGTTQEAAHLTGRRYIGADINLGAIRTATKRLYLVDSCFEYSVVNNYEVFRNPVEAKDLLIEALEIQKLDSNVVYDGEKDGYKVKIMPVNRIATKEDLNELVANFPYKKFEERKAANPNKPVEEIMLVCMGHEPGLGATLENECGYKLKVEVVDILRDKSDLTFKYDSEAVIKVQEGKLIVDAFYPRNLLQKLSQQKDDVAEWREMVESIMIDWNYDGAVMEPIVIDIPDKNEFVAGEYEIPQGASNIKIKITDLLSESYEEVIAHG